MTNNSIRYALALRSAAVLLANTKDQSKPYQSLILKALIKLVRANKRRIILFKIINLPLSTVKHYSQKLILWQTISNPFAIDKQKTLHVTNAIKETEAWTSAIQDSLHYKDKILRYSWNYRERIINLKEIVEGLNNAFKKKSKSQKIFFWHHYDEQGYIPKSWIKIFAYLSRNDWQIVISSSYIQEKDVQCLIDQGCIISLRKNIGLCLGAYADFCSLLEENLNIKEKLKTLVLCNDSTIPVGDSQLFIDNIYKMEDTLNASEPVLTGLTSTVERSAYHIQSYCLAANSLLLKHKIWNEFWKNFYLSKNKEDLINNGEIGLSQYLLSRNIKLTAIYPIASITTIHMLPKENRKRDDLTEINPTLHFWHHLICDGFPLLKKSILLTSAEQFNATNLSISEPLKSLLSSQVFLQDVEQIVKGKYINSNTSTIQTDDN